MATITENIRFLVRGGLASALAALNEVVKARELEFATDARNFKLGDGATAFNSLPWLLSPWTTASGTNTITATFTDKPVLFDGMMVRVRAAGANTGAVTFNPNSLGALAVKKSGGVALVANDIAGADHELLLIYHSSSTWWELANPAQTPAAVAGSGITLIGSATVSGSAATTMAISGLDLSLYKSFRIEFELDNATGSAAVISMYYNSDTTVANYYEQAHTTNNATIVAARANDARIANLDANEPSVGIGWIKNDRDGRPRAGVEINRGAVSTLIMQRHVHAWTSATNVTGITLSSSVANSLAIGSTFLVYGVS